jgi:hypothetical protein
LHYFSSNINIYHEKRKNNGSRNSKRLINKFEGTTSMIILGIIGIILIIWWGIQFTWSVMPYLFGIWLVLMLLGFIIDNWIVILLIAGLTGLAYGIYLEVKKVKESK